MSKSRYLTHCPLRPWQKVLVAVGSGVGSALNPYRADLVAASNETLGEAAFRQIHSSMQNSQRARRILEEKPQITRATLERCRGMEAESFGAAYAEFMDRRRLRPDERPPVRFIDDPEIAYVAARYRQVHDLWHVLLGCSTDMSGEVAVKTVEGIQTGLPNAIFAALLSPLVIKERQRAWFFTRMLPWAVRTGFNATDLMSIYYEHHFEVSHQRVSLHSRF